VPGLLPFRDLCKLALNLIAFLKAFDAALGIQHPAFTREKRVAFAAYLNSKLFFRGAGGEPVAAGTDYLGIREILRVNFLFHIN